MGINRDFWTGWFNVDRPWNGEGDFETVAAIETHYGKICDKRYEIIGAECRSASGDLTFDAGTDPATLPDVFKRLCNTDGVICRNRDQVPFGRMCDDYSIRFRCKYTDDDSSDSFFPQFDVRIYIILAVVPILIFLIRILWAYVYRRRRARRREERRARQRLARNSDDLDDDSSSIASGLANPPPSYKELFGEPANYAARSSVFAISGSNIPVCSKCESKPCSVAMVISKARRASEDASGSSENGGSASSVRDIGPDGSSTIELEVDITVNDPAASRATPTNTSEGAEGGVAEAPVNVMVGDTELTPISSPNRNSSEVSSSASTPVASHNEFSEVDLGDPSQSQDSATEISLAHIATIQIESEEQEHRHDQNGGVNAAGSSAVSLSKTVSNLTESQSVNSPLPLLVSPSFSHPKPDISQPCACTCHRTIPFQGQQRDDGIDNPGFTGEADDVDAQMRPPIPGMHMPVPGIHRVWSSSSVITLSELPSYEDALELMKKKEKEAEAEAPK